MSGAPVELRVAGQTYRVVASADEDELKRLARVVDERLRTLTAPGRQVSAQSLVLVAISLAHDLETERAERRQLEHRSREMLKSLLRRIDAAIDESDRASENSEADMARLPADAFETAPPSES